VITTRGQDWKVNWQKSML